MYQLSKMRQTILGGKGKYCILGKIKKNIFFYLLIALFLHLQPIARTRAKAEPLTKAKMTQ